MDEKATVVCTEKAMGEDTMDKKQLSQPVIATGEKVCSEELFLQVIEQSEDNFGIEVVIEEVVSEVEVGVPGKKKEL